MACRGLGITGYLVPSIPSSTYAGATWLLLGALQTALARFLGDQLGDGGGGDRPYEKH
ncbi:hypothetical protein BP00DRAFT_444920 [Aspergillus indologenus CBS 114.80]|uniref:Uncharacterized protein n=1 Tax=Aspergillus indologenus CBS 114.80 TaxID=1450541 RepID=A0A2V5JCJ9_9EURO|nr:hypothetical protein BP00DRAFT_444920 [Aspergillus indologenus CBS 114.80]